MASIAAPVAAALIVGGEALTASAGATGPDAWHRDAAVLNAFVQARQLPELCGLAVRSLHIPRTGGYTYLHRDVPIYFGISTMTASSLPAPLPLRVELNHAPVPQFTDAELARRTDRFNVIVGAPGDGLPGFQRRACFGAGRPDDRRLCVFERPGDCQAAPP